MSASDRVTMQRRGAAELVVRARHYDQNAMAMLKEIAANAAKGDPVASSALEQVKLYIARHPTESVVTEEASHALGVLKDPRNPPQALLSALGSLPSVGCKEDVQAACAILAIGPEVTEEYVQEFCSAAGVWKDTLLYGIQNAGDDEKLGMALSELGPKGGAPALCAGHCIGMAKRLQAASHGDVAALGNPVGWELSGA